MLCLANELHYNGHMKTLITIAMLALSVNSFASEPVGYYNDGSLIDPECLPAEGLGFEVLQLSRDVGHIFGTTEMIDMLERTASDMARRYPGKDRLQIEDIAARDGGDIDPHSSHENGLDVDLQYFKADGREFRPTPGNPYAPKMYENGRISSNFDLERNWELMKTLHRHADVKHIFIDENLKAELVRYARSKGEYNSNIRVINSMIHVTNHADHLHVRLNCPASARRCHSRNK